MLYEGLDGIYTVSVGFVRTWNVGLLPTVRDV